MNAQKMLKDLGDALQTLQDKHGHFVLECSFADVVIMVAQMQLALRHPHNKGHSAAEARRIVNDMIEALERADRRTGPLLRAGFDAKHDQPFQSRS